MYIVMFGVLAINIGIFVLLCVAIKGSNGNKKDEASIQNTLQTLGSMISENIKEKQEAFNKNIVDLLKVYESNQEKISAMHLEQLKINGKSTLEKQELIKETMQQNLKQF
ncbi:MAG: hypothetical protein IJ758_03410, partial [Clostridia bacterium]|nr:hypothetical protein [Clostridia bacterium]